MAGAKSRKTKSETKIASSLDGQTETLDFTLADPPATPRFSLHRHYGARPENGMWVLEPGGAMQFRLQVAEPEHTILALEVYSPFDLWVEKLAERIKSTATPWLDFYCFTPDSYSPLMLTIGNEDLTESLFWQQNLNPLGKKFATKRMILAPAFLFPGDNFLTLWLSADVGAVPLHLKSVSVSDFSVQRQQQTQWCWAAVTSSLVQFMAPERAASQLEVVSLTLQRPTNKFTGSLNRPWDITEAARLMGLEDGTRYGNVSRDTMRGLVNEGMPIPVQINWRKNARKNGALGDGHYVVVNAIGEEAKGRTLIQVEDPLVGKLNLTWDELKNDYPGQANQPLYKHKEREQCSNWEDDTCQCQWRGKWTYTHLLVPKEWAEDEQIDAAESDRLIKSVDTRLMELAERDGFVAVIEQATQLPTLDEVTTQIENISHQLMKLNHQTKDLEDVLDSLQHLRQFIFEEPAK